MRYGSVAGLRPRKFVLCDQALITSVEGSAGYGNCSARVHLQVRSVKLSAILMECMNVGLSSRHGIPIRQPWIHMDVTGSAYTFFLNGYIFSVRHTRHDGPIFSRERSSLSKAFTSFAS